MAWMEQIEEDYTFAMPIVTARAVENKCPNPLTLEALGLLTNLLSYSGKWELHKTELYTRYQFHKETSVKSAWNKLMEHNYIIEFKYRVGKKWEYGYYFKKTPFTEERKAEILAAAEKEWGKIWGLDFQDSKMETSKHKGNQKDSIKEKNQLKKSILNNDDDIGENPLSEEEQNLINNLWHELKDDLSDRSFKAVVRKVVDKKKQGKVTSFRDYLVTALSNKIVDLEFKKQKEKAREDIKQSKMERWRKKLAEMEQPSEPVPFYNWLEQ